MPSATPTPKPRKRVSPTPDHLSKLEQGRQAGRAIRAYLDYLEVATAPKHRGRKVDWQNRYDAAQAALAETTDSIERLRYTQDIIDAEQELARQVPEVDVERLEEGFIKWGPWYTEHKGISRTAWRSVGVPAAVLRRAGL